MNRIYFAVIAIMAFPFVLVGMIGAVIAIGAAYGFERFIDFTSDVSKDL